MALSDESVARRLVYNGHKRVHCFKFQSVVTPFGIVVHLYGPVEGKGHDAGMVRESCLLADLQQNMQLFPSGVYSLSLITLLVGSFFTLYYITLLWYFATCTVYIYMSLLRSQYD